MEEKILVEVLRRACRKQEREQGVSFFWEGERWLESPEWERMGGKNGGRRREHGCSPYFAGLRLGLEYCVDVIFVKNEEVF